MGLNKIDGKTDYILMLDPDERLVEKQSIKEFMNKTILRYRDKKIGGLY